MRKASEAEEPRAMERREFLGVGAAMGAAGVLGSERIASIPQTRCVVTIKNSDECEREMQTIRWAIPARHLNTLWSLLWPRIAARIWRGGPPYATVTASGTILDRWPDAMNGVDITPTIREWIAWFDQEGHGSECFLQAITELDAYLAASDGCAPVFFLGEGGYDFLLSEDGVELWAPPPLGADPQRKLLANYEHRRTGRPSIGLGGVMSEGEYPPMLVEAPTGPGQIEVMDHTRVDIIKTTLMMNDPNAAPAQFCAVVAGAFAFVDKLERDTRGGRDVGDGPVRLAGLIRSITPPIGHPSRQAMDELIADLPPGPIGFDTARRVIQFAAQLESPCAQIPVDLYECAVTPTHCWILSGSVYRGVLEQFPRFVAEAWGDDPDTDVRDSDPRVELEQRMEMTFPERTHFAFLDVANPDVGGATITVAAGPRARWEPSQVMVTNGGIFFPWAIGNDGATPSAVAGSAPDGNDLLDAIVAGRAGNPVFTDSSRTQ